MIDDPLTVAEQFLQATDLIQGALADDLAARERRLQATKQADRRQGAGVSPGSLTGSGV